MKTIVKTTLLICSAGFLLLGFFGCKEQAGLTGDGVEQTPLNPLVIPGAEEGLVTFLSGNVEKYSGESWVFLEIGDLVGGNDKIRADVDSFCEIQFGDYAVLRIEEETFFAIENIAAGDMGSAITLNLDSGSLLCKVKRLGSGDSFTVLSPSMALGVRGTEFYISTSKGLKYRTALREGSIQLFPASVDPAGMPESLGADSPIRALLEKHLEENSIILMANQEIIIDEKTGAAIEAGNRALDQLFSSGGEPSAALLEPLLRELSTAGTKGPVPAAIADDSVQFLKKIDDLNEVDLNTGAGELVKIAVNSVPKQARVVIDGRKAGITPFAGVFPAGSAVVLEISEAGYITRTIPLTVEKGGDTIMKVTLDLDEDWVPPKEEDPGISVQPDEDKDQDGGKVQAQITVTPASAVIKKNGKIIGSGKYTGEFNPGETVTLILSDPLYQEREVEIKIGTEAAQEYAYSLKLRPIFRTFRISNSPILYLSEAQEALFAVDETGEAFVLDREGTIRSSFQLGFVPDKETRPVFDGERMYLLGGNHLVVADLNQGSLVVDVEVTGSDRYVFGRQIALLEGKGVFPSDDSITFFSTDTGEVLDEIKIAQGMGMTPLRVGNTLVTVNRKGQILVLDEKGEYEDIIPTSVISDGNVFAARGKDFIYFTDDRGSTVCLNSETGSIVWESDAITVSRETDTASHFFLEPGNNGLYLFDGEQVMLLSKAGGSLLFTYTAGGGAPPLILERVLFLSSGNKMLQVIDGVSGRERASISIGSRGTSKPVLIGQFLYLGLESGEVALINPKAF